MSEPKWTHGPWACHRQFPTDIVPESHVERSSGGSIYEGQDATYATTIALCCDDDVAKTGWSHRITREQALANAHLIAAAPELYEALAAVLGWNDEDPTGLGALRSMNHARQVLAKARGETIP